MVKKTVCIIVVFCMLSLVGCFSHVHTVGNGAQANTSTSKKQWYILWGLVPLGSVDTTQMAAGSTDYEVKTQHSVVDVFISLITGIVTVFPRTVTVKK